MYRVNSLRCVLVLSVMAVTTTTACDHGKVSAASAASSDAAKVPITTSSEEARKEYLQGRDLSERLLGQESLQHFDKAIALDPEFAFAELARANNSATTKEFFDHEKKAVSLAEKVSEGERLAILENEAGANGDVAKQKEYLDKLVAAFPNDERVQYTAANYYFAQQDVGPAIEHYKKATEIDPSYSPPYNVLGYAYRQQGDYAGAEQVFRKYIALIPNDPNPYDSYAELLLKMGRFDDSLEQYHKALAVDSHFVPSHFGIAANQMYKGNPDEATAELQKMAEQARNDGELRTALFGMAVVAADSWKLDKALQIIDKEYAVAEKKSDVASMAADLTAKGNILVEVPNHDEALRQFERSLELIQSSNLPQEVKDQAGIQHHFNLTLVALTKRDIATAKTHAEEFRRSSDQAKNEVQVRQLHQLLGRIALAEKDYDKAIAEFSEGNQQNPVILYLTAQAYQGKGDKAKATEFARKAVHFNSLPQLNYAFVRAKAQKMAGEKKT